MSEYTLGVVGMGDFLYFHRPDKTTISSVAVLDELNALLARAEKAEAERDELMRKLSEATGWPAKPAQVTTKIETISAEQAKASPLEILAHQGLGATNLILLSLYVQALIKHMIDDNSIAEAISALKLIEMRVPKTNVEEAARAASSQLVYLWQENKRLQMELESKEKMMIYLQKVHLQLRQAVELLSDAGPTLLAPKDWDDQRTALIDEIL